MTDDDALLRHYSEDRSDAAFATLVQRHLPLVYAAALRQVHGARHRAEEVTQKVFIDLARKAPLLANRTDLAGWLYTATHHAAATLKRAEQRRQRHEQEAHMHELLSAPDTPSTDWDRLRPVLDDVMHELSTRDRQAILLRFFQGLTFPDIGRQLALSDDAARMRVDRALERLRLALARRHITSTAAALGVALAQQPAVAAPAGLAAAVTHTALAHVAATGLGATLLFSAMHTLKTNLLLTSGIVTAAAAFVGWQHQANARTETEIARLTTANQSIATLRADNARLAQVTAEADRLAREAAAVPALRAALAALPPPPSAATPSTAVTIRVAQDHTVYWNGEQITVPDVMTRLSRLGRQAGTPLVIQADPGARFDAVAFVVDEARKAKVAQVATEIPVAQDESNNWF